MYHYGELTFSNTLSLFNYRKQSYCFYERGWIMFELNNKRLVVQPVSVQTINLLMDRRLVTISFCKTETIGVKDTI